MGNKPTILAAAALAVFATAAVAAEPAATPAPAQDNGQSNGFDCLRTNFIDHWHVVDDKTIIVSSGVKNDYKLTLVGKCVGLKWSHSLRFISVGRFMCISPGDFVLVRDLGNRQRCAISNVERYTPPKPADAATTPPPSHN